MGERYEMRQFHKSLDLKPGDFVFLTGINIEIVGRIIALTREKTEFRVMVEGKLGKLRETKEWSPVRVATSRFHVKYRNQKNLKGYKLEEHEYHAYFV